MFLNQGPDFCCTGLIRQKMAGYRFEIQRRECHSIGMGLRGIFTESELIKFYTTDVVAGTGTTRESHKIQFNPFLVSLTHLDSAVGFRIRLMVVGGGGRIGKQLFPRGTGVLFN